MEPGDVYYDFIARTYRRVGVRTVPMVPAGCWVLKAARHGNGHEGSKGLRPDVREESGPNLYGGGRRQPGEIAARLLGNPTSWQDIYELNRDIIGGNPSLHPARYGINFASGTKGGALICDSDFRDEYFRYDVRLAGRFYLGDLVRRSPRRNLWMSLPLRTKYQD